MRLRFLLLATVLPLALWAALPMVSGAAPSQSRLSDLQSRIARTKDKIGAKKSTEHVLSGAIASYGVRIDRLQGRISTLAERQAAIQADLSRKETELERIQAQLRSERARLVRLRKRLAETRTALRGRLIQIYKAERPDVVTVVLGSRGFADLLERGEFIRRISDQDRKIVIIVRNAKTDATRTEQRLNRLEARQQTVTDAIAARRDQVAAVKEQLIGTKVGYARTQAGKAATLRDVRSDRTNLQADVDGLEKASSRIQAQLAAAQRQNAGSFGSVAAQPIKGGSGRFIFPVSGPITGAFGEQRPGSTHAGIDIAAPGGTPIRAAGTGKVVLLQGIGASGGYGNYTCVQHTASVSTCYAHQARFGTSLGARVRRGQVIGFVGNTGNSFGNHLHFEVRVNGVPVGPLGYL